MASRLKLHEEFIDILETNDETESRVYYRPPESKKMKYPCIRYAKADPKTNRANNKVYGYIDKYEGVVIDYDPDSEIPKKILTHFSRCSLGRPYTAENLNHFPFTLYF